MNAKNPEYLKSAKVREGTLTSVLELLKQGIVHSLKWFVVSVAFSDEFRIK